MKVRIEADGSAAGTRMLDANGNFIAGIKEVSFSHKSGGCPEIHVGILLVPATIEGEAKCYGPNGKEVRKVIYADGTEDNY